MFNVTETGKRIKAIRGGMKQEECAKKLGISRAALSSYENGSRTMDIEILYKFSELFNVSADYLLGRTNSTSINDKERAAVDVTGLSDEVVNTLARLNEENKATWTEDILNSILINDNFIMILYYLNELSTKVDLNNQKKEPPYYVTTREIIETALNKYFIKLVDSIIKEYKGCEERDFRIAYQLALNLYRNNKLTEEQYKQVLDEYEKGNFDFVPDGFNPHGGADNG